MPNCSTAEILIGLLIGFVLCIIVEFFINILRTRNKCEEINTKIGTLDNTTLSGQNEMIQKQLQDIQNKLTIIQQKIGNHDN